MAAKELTNSAEALETAGVDTAGVDTDPVLDAETILDAETAGAAEAAESTDTAEKPKSRSAGRTAGHKREPREKALMDLAEELPNEKPRDYILNRVIPQMRWYAKKSAECKKWYVRLMTASIVLGALIPVASVFAGGGTFPKVFIALLGASVTGVNAFLAMQGYRDLWITYRNTREELLRILYSYFNNADVFRTAALANGAPDEKDVLLVELCERQMAQENTGWMTLMKQSG